MNSPIGGLVYKIVTLADINKTTTYPTTTTMKFSGFAIAALAVATSSRCMVAGCMYATAAPKSKKSAKKVTEGPNVPNGGPANGNVIPIGDRVWNTGSVLVLN